MRELVRRDGILKVRPIGDGHGFVDGNGATDDLAIQIGDTQCLVEWIAVQKIGEYYDEIVVDRLYDGKTQFPRAFQPLVEAAEATLELDAFKRSRTVLRADGGAGSQGDVNWALACGYGISDFGFRISDFGFRICSCPTWPSQHQTGLTYHE